MIVVNSDFIIRLPQLQSVNLRLGERGRYPARASRMSIRIPVDFDILDLLAFRLVCECGFRTNCESVGMVPQSFSETGHTSYRAAWLEGDGNLRSAYYRIPIDLHES